ncbi:hypothetical protein [[Bacillus] enclensis]|jgi:hypothetical protein|uniref:hypothetical protein n=1 Tax=[Bacillus] enclensis TaxID=1402860 RepID=UPI0005095CAF|nr:hypothetical protein [[Bacillus] enclensis]MBH9968488.1 hypothetical protein [[Bacillus] enclensis]
MNVNTLKKEANKHKKFLENKVMLNPYSYTVNDIPYYLVIYQRGEKFKGYAVISDSKFEKIDALNAFEKLIIFNVYVNRFFEIEESKMKLKPDTFLNIKNLIKDNLRNADYNRSLNEGVDLLTNLEMYLRELQHHLIEYTQHYDNNILTSNRIDDEEILKLWKTLSHVNRIQYFQGKELIDNFGKLKDMYQEMKDLKLDKNLSEFDRKALGELTSEINTTKRSINSLEFEKTHADLPELEFVEHSIKRFKRIGNEKLSHYKKDLRYPKP